ncbi:glycosyltransferase [Paracoccus gahaiensis]|uniref:Glycosyltransferase n=1 Tax=Paracoccus gahaiensis TaxID=1706839 RepID=A0A4U0R4D1_9RHOB|nr:glycosyltransferase [Paracoccus gahaiensis]
MPLAPAPEAIERIFGMKQFDAVWYRKTFPDVDATQMDPADHFRKYGSIMGRAPNAGFHEDPNMLRALLKPMPKKGGELVSAYEIARHGDHDLAISYARLHLPSERAYTIEGLLANRALSRGRRKQWLGHLNNYLGHFEVAPIAMKPGEQLIDQFATDPLPPAIGGPLVSVIMPAWNAETTIFAAAKSILEQTWRNLELLIVDDASTDSTWRVIQQLAAQDSRVKVFQNAINVGPYMSKNVAVSQAAGEWITGHDADDWAHPERIARQITFSILKDRPATLSGMARISRTGEFVRLNQIGDFVNDGICRAAFISLMVQRQYFKDVLGFWDNVRMAGDSELIHRILKVERRGVPQLRAMTMLCFDTPNGLAKKAKVATNDNSEALSPRKIYKKNFTKFHSSLSKNNSAVLDLSCRRFPAPAEMVNDQQKINLLVESYKKRGISLKETISVDVAIITELRFPGGNASSTLDEVQFLSGLGLKVRLIQCPIDSSRGRTLSERYALWNDLITNWSDVESLDAKVVICRHPRVALSRAFKHIVEKISCDHCYIIKNNSHLRSTGEPVYDIDALVQMSKQLKFRNVIFCPISPVMRTELEKYKANSKQDFRIAESDWNPTFALEMYEHSPRAAMIAPFRIGRHGRDGPEKWHEDADTLRKIFPSDPDFKIDILGGAFNAEFILGKLPENWTVRPFGSATPLDYLATLDAFVYFPNTGLVEGFGRTVVEAMLAGIPVILPRSFEGTFGDLPLYCLPADVENIVRRLSASGDTPRMRYLTEVQEIATARFSSAVIRRRMTGTPLDFLSNPNEKNLKFSLSHDSASYRQEMQLIL